MSAGNSSAASKTRLLPSTNEPSPINSNMMMRDPSNISTSNLGFVQILEDKEPVEENTILQVEIVNEELLRLDQRTKLASKGSLLTYRWQTALVAGLIIGSFAIGMGGIGYWISLPKVITQPYLLYGESCQPNSRWCDETRMLYCPAGRCLCRGDFAWNQTAQNCTCDIYTLWNGLKCQSYGYFGDPCNSVPCRPTLTCSDTINQTYTTAQKICSCDTVTYPATASSGDIECFDRLGYNQTCSTEFDCQDWLGLACTQTTIGLRCRCDSKSYWNGSICASNALGWEYCDSVVPCDTPRGLSCVSNLCQCDAFSYWDNITTFNCEPKKTYATLCQFDFQCNTTVNLSCPTTSTGCNCYATSIAYMCDCQAGDFWDGQRCTARHVFNGTCPGQYACLTSGNLVCFLGHCICPGNMVWNTVTPNQCDCPIGLNWNPMSSTCI